MALFFTTRKTGVASIKFDGFVLVFVLFRFCGDGGTIVSDVFTDASSLKP